MNPILLNLIESFHEKVSEAEEIMKKEFNIDEPRLFRKQDIPRWGHIGKNKYSFHGIGCRFKFEKAFVDYDYGEHGRNDGFDLWRLSDYGRQFEQFKEYIKTDEIKSDLQTSIDVGEIVRSGGKYDNLYYLSKSI